MGKIETLFPQWYYHGQVQNHEVVKSTFLKELGQAQILPRRFATSSFESVTNNDDFSWDLFGKSIENNLIEMSGQLGGEFVKSIQIVQSWINEFRQGDMQEVHDHSGNFCTFSCAYFLQYNHAIDGQFHFFNTSLNIHHGNFSSYYPTSDMYAPEVKEGDIIIFPSCSHHFVTSQPETDQSRITISANFSIS